MGARPTRKPGAPPTLTGRGASVLSTPICRGRQRVAYPDLYLPSASYPSSDGGHLGVTTSV